MYIYIFSEINSISIIVFVFSPSCRLEIFGGTFYNLMTLCQTTFKYNPSLV